MDATNQGSKMFAVFKTGGKQYKVAQNDVVVVEKLTAQVGDLLQFDTIMMVGEDKLEIGTPIVVGAAVHAEVLEQGKNKKVVSFVKRRRKHSSQRTRGHRQSVTVVRVKKILSAGAKVSGDKLHPGVSIIGSNISAKNKDLSKAKTSDKIAGEINDTKKSRGIGEGGKTSVSKTGTTTNPTRKSQKEKKVAPESIKQTKQIDIVDKGQKPEPKAEASRKPSVAKAQAKKKPASTTGEKTKKLTAKTRVSKKSADTKNK